MHNMRAVGCGMNRDCTKGKIQMHSDTPLLAIGLGVGGNLRAHLFKIGGKTYFGRVPHPLQK